MGKGGEIPLVSTEEKKSIPENILRRPPVKKPPFTLSEIKKAIPPHCFKRSLIHSSSYLVFDLVACFLLYHVATTYIPLLPKPLNYLAWTTYIYCQGCTMFATWVLCHELGHHAFSDYYLLNDTIGFILHSLLLNPYFSWKISHRRHHSNTNSLDRDENHVPRLKESIRSYYHYFNNTLGRVLILAFSLILGWPLYLCVNIVGRPYDRFANHFDPYSPIFSKRERFQVVLSHIGVLVALYLIYYVALVKGFAWVMLVYGAPLLVMNAYIVTVTTVQHTHPSVPHYDSTEWDWLRGALATVDRDFGIYNKLFNHVGNTHFIHHLVPTLPHYHGEEATEAIKPLLGDYYLYDKTPFYKAMWREAKECLYVEAEDGAKGVYWFKNKL